LHLKHNQVFVAHLITCFVPGDSHVIGVVLQVHTFGHSFCTILEAEQV